MIGQKAALMTANMVVGTLLGLVAAILVGRYFDPTHVGQLSGTLGILGLIFFITDLGMGSAHVKRVSEGRDAGDCFATFTAFKIGATLAFVLLATGALWFYLFILGKPLVDTTVPIIVLAMGYYVSKSLAEIGQSSFDARLETAKSQSAQLADTIARVGLTIFFALVMAAVVHKVPWTQGRIPQVQWVADNPAISLAVATLVGSVAAAAVSLTLLFRTLEWGTFRYELLKDYASFAFPLFVANAIGLVSLYIDSTVIFFFRSGAEAGIFSQVRRLPQVLQGVGTALSALLFPAVSAMVARHDHAGVQRTSDGAMRYLSMFLVPSVAFTAAFPVQIIHLTLGDKWTAGATALALLSVYVLLVTFGHVHSFLLLGYGRSDAAAKVGIAAALTLIVLNIALVPDDIQSLGLPLAGWGITGSAIATVISGIVWYVGMRWSSHRIANYREGSHLWRQLVAAGAMVGVLYLMDLTFLPFLRWYHFLIYLFVGALVYGSALIAVRGLTNADLAFARSTLHPGAMLRYIRGEIRGKE